MRPIWLKPPKETAGFEVESAGSMLPPQTYTITRLEPASRVSDPKISKSQNVEESFSSV
jgi:hypothetical protein